LHIFDRWGLPIVPWTSHILKASLCKKDDHGIAMLFGLTCPEGQEFDSVEHFDFSRCTVTIDSQYTDKALKNYSSGTWDEVRATLEEDRGTPKPSILAGGCRGQYPQGP
jgi:hypothetical protein